MYTYYKHWEFWPQREKQISSFVTLFLFIWNNTRLIVVRLKKIQHG